MGFLPKIQASYAQKALKNSSPFSAPRIFSTSTFQTPQALQNENILKARKIAA